MKTIFRILMILLVGAIVAGAFFLAVNNAFITSSAKDRQLHALTSDSPFANQTRFRPEGGDRDGGSITRGVGGVLGTLGELTGITILVVLIQKGFGQISKGGFIPVRQ